MRAVTYPRTIRRGDVYHVKPHSVVGHAQQPDRPAVVVSNELNNRHSPTVEIVYLTSRQKKTLPTHVAIHSIGIKNTALCEQVTTVDRRLLGRYICTLTGKELNQINDAIKISLSL